jgi:DNA-binding NtrC family response regulator
MVTINAGGVSEGVFESELFGHVKGAFTDARQDRVGRFELADGSTLFPRRNRQRPAQPTTEASSSAGDREFERLGSSRTRKADVRLIAATNANINAEVSAGRFRQDLLFRLNTVEVHLPPLRDRREDIPAWPGISSPCMRCAIAKPSPALIPKRMQALLEHRWPGNIRELDHAIERGVLMAGENVIHAGDLWLRPADAGDIATRLDELSLEEVEGFLIQKAMARYGTVSHAAKALGLSRSALYRRLDRHRLS